MASTNFYAELSEFLVSRAFLASENDSDVPHVTIEPLHNTKEYNCPCILRTYNIVLLNIDDKYKCQSTVKYTLSLESNPCGRTSMYIFAISADKSKGPIEVFFRDENGDINKSRQFSGLSMTIRIYIPPEREQDVEDCHEFVFVFPVVVNQQVRFASVVSGPVVIARYMFLLQRSIVSALLHRKERNIMTAIKDLFSPTRPLQLHEVDFIRRQLLNLEDLPDYAVDHPPFEDESMTQAFINESDCSLLPAGCERLWLRWIADCFLVVSSLIRPAKEVGWEKLVTDHNNRDSYVLQGFVTSNEAVAALASKNVPLCSYIIKFADCLYTHLDDDPSIHFVIKRATGIIFRKVDIQEMKPATVLSIIKKCCEEDSAPHPLIGVRLLWHVFCKAHDGNTVITSSHVIVSAKKHTGNKRGAPQPAKRLKMDSGSEEDKNSSSRVKSTDSSEECNENNNNNNKK